MMWFWIFLAAAMILMIILLIAVLLMRVVIELDTEVQTASVSLKPAFRMNFSWTEDSPRWTIHVFGYRIRPEAAPGKTEAKELPPARPRVEKRRYRITITLIRRVLDLLRSFRVEKLWVDIDSGDVVTNAYLYPLSGVIRGIWWSREPVRFHINYDGVADVKLRIHNRVYRILWHVIRVAMALKRK